MMIEVTGQISAVERKVGTRVLAGGDARVMTVSQQYRTDIGDLWDACTSAERIGRWFLPVSGDMSLGGRYQLEGNAGGTIERCDPPNGFAATWEFGGQVSWIEVRLTAEQDGWTRLELEHVAHVDDHWDQFGPGAVGIGWDMALVGLVRHLEGNGEAVDREAAAAWVASPGGRRFMELSNDRWRDANIAAGAGETEATAAADRCLAAYTGTTT
jgi:uncharacterized protein YndB with AHSA1/START domain